MTRPDPLGVECQYCWASEGEPCYVQGRVGGRDKNQRSPHAARIWAARHRADDQERREKEGNRG